MMAQKNRNKKLQKRELEKKCNCLKTIVWLDVPGWIWGYISKYFWLYLRNLDDFNFVQSFSEFFRFLPKFYASSPHIFTIFAIGMHTESDYGGFRGFLGTGPRDGHANFWWGCSLGMLWLWWGCSTKNLRYLVLNTKFFCHAFSVNKYTRFTQS